MFVNLKKANDSVPRNALWTALAKCGVPPTMLSIIWSFHDKMAAGGWRILLQTILKFEMV